MVRGSVTVGIASAMAAVGIVIGLTACGGPPLSSAKSPGRSSTPTSTSTPALSAGQQQFVNDMRGTFSFDSSVQDDTIATFGQQVCSDLQGGNTVATEVPFAEKSWSNMTAGDAIQMVTLATKDICPSQAKPQTVTYAVTGDSADVTYGPAGSNFQGVVPMSVTQPLGSPSYYSIDAQLNAGGSVTCELAVDGVSISTASASGAYNIASCEIDQSPATGSWENTNNG